MPPPPTLAVSPEEVSKQARLPCPATGSNHTYLDKLIIVIDSSVDHVRFGVLQLEFFAEEEPIQIVPNCSVPGGYIDGVLVSSQ